MTVRGFAYAFTRREVHAFYFRNEERTTHSVCGSVPTPAQKWFDAFLVSREMAEHECPTCAAIVADLNPLVLAHRADS